MRTSTRHDRRFNHWSLSLLLGGALATAAWAQAALSFDIPAQDLAVALESFAAQADKEVLFDREQALGKQSASIKGQLEPAAALKLLIAPTGLPVRQVNDRTFVVGNARTASESAVHLARAQPPAGAPSQSGAQPASATTDGELEEVLVFGGLNDRLSVGSKSGLSLREVPKSVTIVTRERIEVQNLTSLLDVLQQTTGIAVQTFGPVDNFYYSRGFEVQAVQIDGGAPGNLYGFGSYLTPDTAQYERVEILRGVDGMYTGAGEPGGVINLVRKRARPTREIQLSLSGGRWNDYRGELDVTGPLAQDGRLRGRLVGAYNQNDYFYDRASAERAILFGTAEFDLTPSTLLIAGASYEKRKEDGYPIGGLPLYADGTDLGLPRSASLVPEWNRWHSTTKDVFARIEQQLGAGSVIKLNVTRMRQGGPIGAVYPYGAVDPVSGTGPVGYYFTSDYRGIQKMADLSASGKLGLFGREHSYTMGIDYTSTDGSGFKAYQLFGADGEPFLDGEPFDVIDFDPSRYPAPSRLEPSYGYPQWRQAQRGFYATFGAQLTGTLRLILGGRYGKFWTRYDEAPFNADGSFDESSLYTYDHSEDTAFIPSAALSWDFAEHWTGYLSYGETFKVQAGMLQGPPPGSPLSPITGSSLELGMKGEVLTGITAAIAVYRVARNGEGLLDPRYPPTDPNGRGASCCYLSQANVTVDGMDLEASGTVLPGWQLFAGYTYGRKQFDGGETFATYNLNLTPKHMLKLWSTWQLPGERSRWTLSAGVVAQSKIYVSGFALAAPGSEEYVPYDFAQGRHALWNASVQYRLGGAWTLGLYGENLSDEKYYSAIGGAEGSNYYGAPRSYVLTLRGNW